MDPLRRRLVTLAALLLVLAGCKETPPPPLEAPRCALPAAGLPGPVVLRPRQRVTSSVPGFFIVTPGLPETLSVEIGRLDGPRHRFKTRRRSLTWPEHWPGLRPGEAAWIRVLWRGRQATAGFVRVIAPPSARGLLHPEAAVASLLERGLWTEALRLATREELPETAELRRARGLAGLPNWGLWRQLGDPAILRRSMRNR